MYPVSLTNLSCLAVLLIGYWLISARLRPLLLVLGGYILIEAYSPLLAAIFIGVTGCSWLGATVLGRACTGRGLIAAGFVTAIAAGMIAARWYFAAVAQATQVRPPSWVAGPVMQVCAAMGVTIVCFHAIGYLLAVYRGRVRRSGWWSLALYHGFFPLLSAGPMAEQADFQRRFDHVQPPAPDEIGGALLRIARGLIKKLVLADTLGVFVGAVIASPGDFSGISCWCAAYVFAIQFYLGFSGLVDMAIGVAQLLGIRLPENFDAPLLASNPSAFLQRWNITLTEWLRTHVGVSTLSGGIVAFAIGAAWYGQSLGVFLGGALFAVAWWVWRKAQPTTAAILPNATARAIVGWGITFNVTALALLLFRCGDWPTIASVLTRMFTLADGPIGGKRYVLIALLCLAMQAATRIPAFRPRWHRLHPAAVGSLLAVAVWVCILLSPDVHVGWISLALTGS